MEIKPTKQNDFRVKYDKVEEKKNSKNKGEDINYDLCLEINHTDPKTTSRQNTGLTNPPTDCFECHQSRGSHCRRNCYLKI